MGDDDADTIEVFEHGFYRFFRMEVEMISRFIHDDDMRTSEEHLGESHFRAFSARERTDSLMPFLILDEETSEHRAYFLILIVSLCELIHDRGVMIEVSEDLRVGADSETLILDNFS